MAEEYFDRYGAFKVDGQVKTIPFLPLKSKPTDISITVKEITRFDRLSQKYYANGKHGFLILMANPSFGGLSENIPIGSVIRIPFPFKKTIQELQEKTKRHIELYGI